MRIFLPNSANLQNITALLPHIDVRNNDCLIFGMHPKWVAVHPVVLSLTAALASYIRSQGGVIEGEVTQVPTLPYLMRMGLFNFLGIDPGREIIEHEESGRFVPITQIKTNNDLKSIIANLVPLLHAPKEVADPIRYVFSEMVRNALEHAQSPVGAFVCAQYYRESKRIAIGIADCGIGILGSMKNFHSVPNDTDAIRLALQPGITGTTSRVGGNEYNAGAGLFFTKSIATLSRNRFIVYSGESMFRLMKTRARYEPELQANPDRDPHEFAQCPQWPGTVIGIDLNIEQGIEFSDLLDHIRKAYFIDVKAKKDYTKRIRFS